VARPVRVGESAKDAGRGKRVGSGVGVKKVKRVNARNGKRSRIN
jgi:hypothetical protein